MKCNKKGFTLVELLAVIVVLAIIMIIAIPSVLNSMATAKKNSFKVFGQDVIRKAMEIREIAELDPDQELKNCYTLDELKLETGGRYTGVVVYDATNAENPKYLVYLADGNYYINAADFNTLSNTDNILKIDDTHTVSKTTCP